jgi:hypothetical protein
VQRICAPCALTLNRCRASRCSGSEGHVYSYWRIFWLDHLDFAQLSKGGRADHADYSLPDFARSRFRSIDRADSITTEHPADPAIPRSSAACTNRLARPLPVFLRYFTSLVVSSNIGFFDLPYPPLASSGVSNAGTDVPGEGTNEGLVTRFVRVLVKRFLSRHKPSRGSLDITCSKRS